MDVVYMLIITDAGELENVFTQVMKKPNIMEAHVVTGAYDIIAKISTPYIAEAMGDIIRSIRKIHGVKNTQTLVCVRRVEK